MDWSCNKDSSSSEFSESFSENGNSFYSETSSKMNSDSNLLDEYYENDISRALSAAIDTQNSDNDDQWIQIANWASNIISKTIEFSPMNTPGLVDCGRKISIVFYIYLGKNS